MKTGIGQSKYRNLTLFHVISPCKSLLDCNVFNVINDKEQQKFYLWNNRIKAFWNNVGRK